LDILPFSLEVDNTINNLKTWMKPTFTKMPAIAAPATSEIRYEPLGVCLIIAPFNYPFYLTMGPLIGAIAGGNCAIIKPSDLSKCTEQIIFKLIPQYMDTDCYEVVTGPVSTTTALLNQKWDKIFFTGSTRVGKIVLQAAVKHLTPCALELGGKSPTIIDKSVTNMELAAKRILWGKLINSGQVSYVIKLSLF
jgi:aldehyde dehydrogenase (NAD+)